MQTLYKGNGCIHTLDLIESCSPGFDQSVPPIIILYSSGELLAKRREWRPGARGWCSHYIEFKVSLPFLQLSFLLFLLLINDFHPFYSFSAGVCFFTIFNLTIFKDFWMWMKGGVNRCEEFKVSTTYHQVAPQNKPKEFDQMNYYIATLITLEAKMILTSCLEVVDTRNGKSVLSWNLRALLRLDLIRSASHRR